jgi:hypothetical protein
MELTEETKLMIDGMSYEQLLSRWRFGQIGDPIFTGEVGAYYSDRMAKIRNATDGNRRHVAASKRLGWGPGTAANGAAVWAVVVAEFNAWPNQKRGDLWKSKSC